MLLYMSEFLMNKCVPGIYRTYCRLTLTVGMGIALGNWEEWELCAKFRMGNENGNTKVIPAHL